MINLSSRILLPEKMDDPSVPYTEVSKALKELEIINQWLGGYAVILDALASLNLKGSTVSLMDIGCGGGDALREIAEWGKRENVKLNLTGVDMNPLMIEYSELKSYRYTNIAFKAMNVWDEHFASQSQDIVLNSLFCHHFDDEELVLLVKRMMDISKKAVIINDIHRHWFAYYSIKYITGLFSKTYLVKYDAPLSVARSLTREEWETILQKAGARNYSIKWKWAWRWQIIIYK